MTTTFQVAGGDVVMDARTGRPKLLSGRVKLRQDVGEMLGVERLRDGFGAGLVELVGRVSSPFALQAEVARRVREGVAAMQALQRRFHWSERPDEERLLGLQQLVVGLARDPATGALTYTDVTFRADVVTVAGSFAVSNEET